MLRKRNNFEIMVHHVVNEEGLNPRNGTRTVGAQGCANSISNVIASGGHNQLIATDKLTEGQREKEQ